MGQSLAAGEVVSSVSCDLYQEVYIFAIIGDTVIKRSSSWILLLLTVFLLNTTSHPSVGADLSKLGDQDKAQLAEYYGLKKRFGSQIWPGFAEAHIPLILYNERYAFLIGNPHPPSPWAPVENDSFQGDPYYRKAATGSQAFAVPVGDLWAGSLDTFGSMNRSMARQMREKIPPEKLTPSVIKMMSFSPAQHTVALLHEAFHAYMAMQDQNRFLQAEKMYTLESSYPFKDEEFRVAWDKEGSALAAALREQEDQKRFQAIEKFLNVREKRRNEAGFTEKLTTFECELEWLEGLAKYVEMRFAEHGASMQDEGLSRDYRVVRNRLRADLYFRLRNLGGLEGDLRFYLSGAAQAMILDAVKPGWKARLMGQSQACLEELLAEALKKNSRQPSQSGIPESQ